MEDHDIYLREHDDVYSPVLQFIHDLFGNPAGDQNQSSGRHVEPVTSDESRFVKFKAVIMYLGIMVGTKIVMTIVNSVVGFELSLLGFKIRNTLNLFILNTVHRKCMERENTFSMGEITNLTQVDANKFGALSYLGTRIVIIPFEMTFGIVMLYKLMGHALWPALGIMLVVLLFNTRMGMLYKKYQLNIMDVKDRRGKIINEIFKNIRFLR